jgi:hypothetical protein
MNVTFDMNVIVNVKKNTKTTMKRNATLQLGPRCRNGKFAVPEAILADVHRSDEAEMSRRHEKPGSSGGELQMLLCFGSKAMIKYVAMYRPMMGCGQSHWHMDKEWTPQMGIRYYRFAGYPGGQIKAPCAGGAACHTLWLVCTADPTGPVSKDASVQPAEATPRRKGSIRSRQRCRC